MKNRLRHSFITFVIIAVAGLGSAQASSSLCSVGCALSEISPEVSPVSCRDDGPDAAHNGMASEPVPINPAVAGTSDDFSHAELCPDLFQSVDIGLNSSNLFDAFVLYSVPVDPSHQYPAAVPVKGSVLQPPLQASRIPLYTRNCSYLI